MSAAAAKKQESPALFKLRVERAVFLQALGQLQGIVERRNTIAILSNIKLEAKSDGLYLTATDMDLAATRKINANIEEAFALTVPAHTLFDIVRKLPDGAEIELQSNPDTSQLRVKSGNAKFNLSYLPAEQFPVMAEGEFTHNFTLPASELLKLVNKTRFAVSTEETRYYLNGIYLHPAAVSEANSAQVLKAVATDGHRLARVEAALPEGAEGMPGIIIPRKTVAELYKALEGEESEVSISLSENKIKFTMGPVVLVSKLIDGTFPDYERVIPKSNDKPLTVNARQFASAVDLVSTVATDKTRAIKLLLSSGKVTLQANSAESASAEQEVEATYGASALDIGFNSRYMMDMMAQLSGETAEFLFSDPAAPVLVRDPAETQTLYVIMPMRV